MRRRNKNYFDRESKKESNLENAKFLYFTCILIFTIVLSIAVSIYCYLIKYKAKQKQLLPFYVTNNKLKKLYFIQLYFSNIRIYYIGYVTIKDLKYGKINSVNPLYLILGKMNGLFEEINKNKYLTLVSTNESKEIIKM